MAIYNVKIVDAFDNESTQPIGALASNVLLSEESMGITIDMETATFEIANAVTELMEDVDDLQNNSSATLQFSVKGSNLQTGWYRIAQQKYVVGSCNICIIEDVYSSDLEQWKTMTYNLLYQSGGKDISKGSFRILGNSGTEPENNTYIGVNKLRVIELDGYRYLDIYYDNNLSDFDERDCSITITNLCNYDYDGDSAIWIAYKDENNNQFVLTEDEFNPTIPHVYQELTQGVLMPYESQFTVRAENITTSGWYRFAKFPYSSALLSPGVIGISISETGSDIEQKGPGGFTYFFFEPQTNVIASICYILTDNEGSPNPNSEIEYSLGFSRIRQIIDPSQGERYLELYFNKENVSTNCAITVSNLSTYANYINSSYIDDSEENLKQKGFYSFENVAIKWEPYPLTYIDNANLSDGKKIQQGIAGFNFVPLDGFLDYMRSFYEVIENTFKRRTTAYIGYGKLDDGFKKWYKIARRLGPENAFNSVGSYECDFYINHPSGDFPGEYKHFKEVVTGASGTEGKEQAIIRKMISSYGGATFPRSEFANVSVIPNAIYALRIVRSKDPIDSDNGLYEYVLEVYWAGHTHNAADYLHTTVDFKGASYTNFPNADYSLEDFRWNAWDTPIVDNRNDSDLVIEYILEAPFNEVAPATTADLVELKDEILAEAGGGDAASISYDDSKVEPAFEQNNVQDALDTFKDIFTIFYEKILEHEEKIAALETEVANLRTEFLGEIDTVAEIVGGEEGTP